VIVIDDIDRLQDEEIRDVMRLVRLVADFPNTVYLLSYDQERVERALGREGESGRAYLEKVVQIVHHVPELRESDLVHVLIEKLNEIVQTIPDTNADNDNLQNIVHFGIKPLFRGLRDIYRFVNALRPTLEQTGDEVAISDVLAMEALRVTHPAVFDGIIRIVHSFTPTQFGMQRAETGVVKKMVTDVIARGRGQEEEIQRLLTMVFPTLKGFLGGMSYGPDWIKSWRKARRMAYPDVLNVYLTRAIPEGTLPSRAVREFLGNMDNEAILSERLEHMSPAQLEQLLGRLVDYENDFQPDTVATAITVLAEQLPRMRQGRAAVFDPGADLVLSEVISRLLRRVQRTETAVLLEKILPRLSSLSARGLVVEVAKRDELLGKQEIVRFEAQIAEDLLKSTADQLTLERDLTPLLHNAKLQDQAGYARKLHELVMHDRAFTRLLVSGLRDLHSQVIGNVVGSVEHVLPLWDDLESVMGKEALDARIRALDNRRSELFSAERDKLALDAALLYLTGWRPKQHRMRQPSATIAEEQAEEESVSDPNPDVPA
jgi:predicted KAP-like P-loop ATPase